MAAALEEILQRHAAWRGGALKLEIPSISSGYEPLDEALPGGGWPTGALTEILGSREGIGELQLVLPALAALSWAGKRVLWLAPPHLPYAPALAAAGIDLAQLSVVRAPSRRDALWAAEQVLRAGCCHALLGWFPRADYDELRRLAVAAESSPAWVALFRAPHAASESSPACLRLALEAEGDVLCVRILKRRGAPAAAPLRLPLKRPVHALGRPPFPVPAAGRARAGRRLGLPVHA
jgi:cell division inhibitor SulA/protein ImuA